MEAETPAEGIMAVREFGSSKLYYIRCECGNEDCAHTLEVEANDICGIQVHIYQTQHTKWWEINRWKQIWQIITKGYVSTETTLVLSEQSAINYSEVLKKAVNDIKYFEQRR